MRIPATRSEIFWPNSIPPPPGFAPWPKHHLDGVGLAEVVGVHPVPRRKVLVHQVLALAAFLGGHAAVAGGGRRADRTGAATQCLLRGPRQRTERHAGDGYRNVEVQRLFGVPGAEHHVGVAAFAVALQWITRHRRAEEQQIVEVGERPLGTPAADVVDAGFGGALDRGDGGPVECRGFAKAQASAVVCVVISSCRVVDVEVVKRSGPTRTGCSRGVVVPETCRLEQSPELLVMFGAHLLGDAVRAQRRDLTAHVDPGLVDRVTQCVARIAAHHQAAGLGHEGAHVPDVAADDDVDALHRDATPRCGIAVDDQQSAVCGRAGGLGRVALDPHDAAHHVLGDAGACVAVDDDLGLLVHARGVVADVPDDGHLDGGVAARPRRCARPRGGRSRTRPEGSVRAGPR